MFQLLYRIRYPRTIPGVGPGGRVHWTKILRPLVLYDWTICGAVVGANHIWNKSEKRLKQLSSLSLKLHCG